ncbi:MAG TPA: hypothetical protein VMZ53_33790 [Kofleriaceae bacterium]|nr:hypothetical protein [Kofleriaceae bacterium]
MSRALACCMLLLCGCPTVDLGDDPPDVGLCNPRGGLPYFQNEIVPKYLKLSDKTNGCGRSSACHDRAHGLAFDLLNPTSTQNYRLTQNYLNCGSPMQSDLLTKPLAGQVGHGGGDLVQPSSTEETTFLMWF